MYSYNYQKERNTKQKEERKMIDFQAVEEKFANHPCLVDVESLGNGIELNSIMDEYLSAFALDDGRVLIESSHNDPIVVAGNRTALIREMNTIINNW